MRPEHWLFTIPLRLRSLFRRAEADQELDEELRDHLERKAEEYATKGMALDEAWRRARLDLGGIEQTKEKCRDARRVNWIQDLIQDTRYSFRMLRKSPGFTAVAVLTLALGIGANTAIFSMVNTVLLRNLAYPNADRLVWLSDHGDWGDNMVSPAAYALWRDATFSFDRMVAYGNQDLALITGGESSQERVASVTGGFWEITGAQPRLGRLFSPGEPNTIVLSHTLFERRFGSDPAVIGKTVTLNEHPFTIIGVLPQNFQFLFPQQFSDERREIDAYVPLPGAILDLWSVTVPQYEAVTHNVGPAPWALYVVGRLRPDVPFERAESEMQTIYARVKEEHYPSWQQDLRLHIDPLKDKVVGNSRTALIVMFGAVCFVLMIASSNIANLLLARASTRQKEIAIRAVVGAGHGRLIRQLVVESILLGLLGGAAGLAVSRWALTVVVQLGSEVIPRVGQAHIDGPVLVFTLAVSLMTGLFFGLGPAVFFLGGDLHDALKNEARRVCVSAGQSRLSGLLMAAELALAIVLLSGAGLMLKSLRHMTTYPQGFDPEKVLVMRVPLYGERYKTLLQQDTYIRELLRRIDAIPGAEASGVHRGTLNTAVKVESAASPLPGKEPYASVQGVSASYLRAMGVPLLRGEWPKDGSFDTFVINESFVRQILGHNNPIGKHLRGSVMNGTIVGVVADFKTWQLDAEPSPEVYIPYQLPPAGRSVRVVVRTASDPMLVAPIIRKLAAETDPTQPVYEVQTLDHALSNSIAPRRFNLFLLGTFAAMALAMALVGAYGVMAYLVAQRTHEIGVRIALGGRARNILTLVIGQAIRACGIGVAIGVGASLILTRAMQSLLFGVSATDPMTLVAVVLLLIFVVLIASYIPVRRAMRVDPMVALRYE